MVATVGSISVDLAVKSAAFEAGFRKAATTVDRETGRMSKSVAGVERSLASLTRAGAVFGSGLAGAFGAREIIAYADAWTQAGNKIRSATEISGKQARSLRELNDLANQTRSGLTETVSLYSRLLLATSKVAKSEEEVARATEIVNKSFKAGGAAASEQAAGILQLAQALGSGVLQGDELRSLRENAPLLAQAIADEFKTTIGGLKDLGAAGELTAERVFKAILAGKGKIDAAFAQTTPTIAEGFTHIGNAATELIGVLSGATNGATTFVGALGNFAGELERTADAVQRFHDNRGLKNFLDILFIRKPDGSFGDPIIDALDGIGDASNRSAEQVKSDITAIQAKIADLEATAAAFGDNEFIKLNLDREREELARLIEELAKLERVAKAAGANGGGAMDSLLKSAENALRKVDEVGAEIDSLKNKTVTITLHTVRTSSGGTAQIGVTSLGGVTVPGATTGTTSGQRKTADQLLDEAVGLGPPPGGYESGGFTGAGPTNQVAGFVHGGEYVIDAETTKRIGVKNLDAISRGMRGYQTGGGVGTGVGGMSVLGMIEMNTFQTWEEIKRAVGYLETLETDGQTMLAVMRSIQSGIGSLSRSGSSGGSSSFGGSSGGSGSFPFGGYVAVQRNDLSGFYTPGWNNNPNFGKFATGGMYPSGGDTQPIQFFKNPNEAVAIFKPEQMAAIGEAMQGTTVYLGGITVNMPPGSDMSPRSMMELEDRFAAGVKGAVDRL